MQNFSGEEIQRGRGFAVDPNLPRWICQNCRQPFSLLGVDSYADKFLSDHPSSCSGVHGSSIHVANSVLGSTRMDNSFVVLPKQRPPQAPDIPPRSAASHVQSDASTSPAGKAMDESFVVVYKNESPIDGGGSHLPVSDGGRGIPLQHNNSGFNSTINILKRAFEIATSQTQVEQLLCLECMRVLADKLDKEVEDANMDIEAYEACLQRLEGETRDVLSEADFLKEKIKIEEEERKLKAAIEETDKQFQEVTTELKELDLKSGRFKELEERYWNEFNNFQFQLMAHQEERDAILAKIEVSQSHLELLKRTSVLNDAFPIGHDGDFGTINNFRLGRLPKIPVEWDEINAAWGQACLLLHTMCQYFCNNLDSFENHEFGSFLSPVVLEACRGPGSHPLSAPALIGPSCYNFRPKFAYHIKILPMGSYPRIMDVSNNTYELCGPVNLFWSTRYDKAMTLFLTCLKDFAEFAYLKDQENNIPAEKCFKLPYKIENDRVENYSITQSFNKQENWTKALKYTLRNLKWALYWFIGNTDFQPLSAGVSQHAGIPAVGTLHPKRASLPSLKLENHKS